MANNMDRLPKQVEALRERYVDIGVRLFALLSVYILLISLMRIPQTGWLNLYLFQGALSILLVTLALARSYFSARLKSAIMVGIAFFAGIAGVISFGLLGSGFFYFVLAGLFLAVFFSRRMAYFITLIGCAIMIGVGYLHQTGHIHFTFDANAYMQHMSSWWTVIFGPFMVGAFLMYLFGDVRQKLVDAFRQLELQRNELDWHSRHDVMTRLPNMRYLEQAFPEWVLRSGERDCELCVMVLDLDGFKQINDRFGHQEGDYALKELAGRFQFEMATSDTIARLGGDEFVVVMRGIEDRMVIHDLAKRLLATCSHPLLMSTGERTRLGVSIGGFCFRSGEQISLNEAIYRADAQMYLAKADGKQCIRLIDSSDQLILPPTADASEDSQPSE